MPWESGSEGKYQYHPGGDTSAAPKDAPSALNVVIVPNVKLTKVRGDALMHARLVLKADGNQELHEKYNKWGKDGYP